MMTPVPLSPKRSMITPIAKPRGVAPPRHPRPLPASGSTAVRCYPRYSWNDRIQLWLVLTSARSPGWSGRPTQRPGLLRVGFVGSLRGHPRSAFPKALREGQQHRIVVHASPMRGWEVGSRSGARRPPFLLCPRLAPHGAGWPGARWLGVRFPSPRTRPSG
jgi:hypothetical protein